MSNRVKVLLVDDRDDNLVALEAILNSLDLEMVRVRSGEDALKALLTGEFAVILLDVLMPGMDGFETASHIKSRDKTKDIPIIFLTAADSAPGYAFRGYAAGAVDYLTKPFDPWVLRAKVAVFVELHRKSRQLREQAELLRTALAEESTDASREDVLIEFSGRVAAIEDQMAVIRNQAADEQGVSADSLGQLEECVIRLRAALDALRPV